MPNDCLAISHNLFTLYMYVIPASESWLEFIAGTSAAFFKSILDYKIGPAGLIRFTVLQYNMAPHYFSSPPPAEKIKHKLFLPLSTRTDI